ncbi:DUF4349 domain-containing protein [Flindersiella endophytica]
MRTSRSRLAAALLGVALAAALGTGCSAAERSSAGLDSNEAAAPKQAQPQQQDSDAGAEKQQGPDASKNRARVTITERSIIRTGTMTIRAKDVQLAADKASALVGGGDGYVGDIQTTSNDKGQTVGIQVVLRVPVGDYNHIVAEVKKLGTVTSNSHKATDVTKDLTDVESRIASQKKSIERLRTLMSQANTVGDVIQVESELTTREADLESLQSQQATLSAQAALSTLTLNFEKPPAKPAPAAAAEDKTGFLPGLKSGWHALVATVDVTLTVLGALLPFLVGIAIIGVLPAWLLIRHRRRGTSTPPAASPAETG